MTLTFAHTTCCNRNGGALCIYGDPVYPLRPQLMTGFKGNNITQLQRDWNKAMNKTRTSVEWVFGDMSTIISFWISIKI